MASRLSSLRTIPLPLVDLPACEPIRVATADDVPVRVVLRCIDPHLAGTARARVGFNPGDLINTPSIAAPNFPNGDFWELTNNEIEIFVLAPKQELYGVSAVAVAQLSIAQSDAFPIQIKKG